MARPAFICPTISRRRLLMSLSRLTGASLAWTGLSSGVTGEGAEASYRIDATVYVLGVPVARRQGAGEARVSIRLRQKAGGRRLELQFAACSDPARARGLDRRGLIRETAEETGLRLRSAAVLGIMTEGAEPSAAAGRQSLHPGEGAQRFVALDSLSLPGRTRTLVSHFECGSGAVALDGDLAAMARISLETFPRKKKETAWPGEEAGEAPGTFLYSLLRAIEPESPEAASTFVYNENRYALRLETAGRETAVRERLVLATVRNLTQPAPASEFKLWLDDAPYPLPLRIELQPRSFLKLTLERTGIRCFPPDQETL